MEIQIAIVLLTVVLAVAITVWGAFTKRRSVAVAIVAFAVAGLGGCLSYYACVETQSMPWAVGYGLAAVLSAVVMGRHFWGVARRIASGSPKVHGFLG